VNDESDFIRCVAENTREMLDEMTAFELHLCICESDKEQTLAWWAFLNYIAETIDREGLEETRKHQKTYPSVCEKLHKIIIDVYSIAAEKFTVLGRENLRAWLEDLASEVFEIENNLDVILTSEDLI
jgi:hypothetical protein